MFKNILNFGKFNLFKIAYNAGYRLTYFNIMDLTNKRAGMVNETRVGEFDKIINFLKDKGVKFDKRQIYPIKDLFPDYPLSDSVDENYGV